MCCALPVFAEAGSSPLPEQSAIGFMLTRNVFYKLHGHDTVEWLHLPNEDRVRFRSWLITEIILLRVVAPLQD